MKTLRIYGDSFAAREDVGRPPLASGWGVMLGNLLGLPVKNKAISGSSTEYAIKLFVDDVENNIIDDNDIIIFLPSSTGRLYFTYQLTEAPETASLYLHVPQHYVPQEWYWKNKDHIEWWMVNHNRRMQEITHESYIQLLKNFAVSNPSCTVIVLPTFPGKYKKNIFDNITSTNFLRANIFLMNINQSEVGIKHEENFDYKWWTEFTKIDPRSNHLTIPNLTILANLLVESIQNSSIDNITYDKFKTNVIEKITSKEQYLKYVANGLIPNRYDILNNLK
jgi:hypothetical protein